MEESVSFLYRDGNLSLGGEKTLLRTKRPVKMTRAWSDLFNGIWRDIVLEHFLALLFTHVDDIQALALNLINNVTRHIIIDLLLVGIMEEKMNRCNP